MAHCAEVPAAPAHKEEPAAKAPGDKATDAKAAPADIVHTGLGAKLALFGIGVFHMVVLWNGDILALYAMAGLLVLPALWLPRRLAHRTAQIRALRTASRPQPALAAELRVRTA